MAIEAPIITRLLASASVTSLVGQRVSPQLRRQGDSTPAIVYEVSEVIRYDTMQAAGTLCRLSMRIDCIADGYADSRDVAAGVRAAVDGQGFTGVLRCAVVSETTGAAVPDDGQGDAERITTLTLVAWIQE